MKPYHTKPILLLMWNRPDCVLKALHTLSIVKPSSLYVASDGFTKNCHLTNIKVQECRHLVSKYVTWNCQLRTLYRRRNLGCRDAVSDAITWFFQHEEAGIILEDDVLCDLSFFQFSTELLDTYHDNPRIGLISANSFNTALLPLPLDFYTFTAHPHIWGWATWRRVWDMYDKRLTYPMLLRAIPRLAVSHGLVFTLFWLYTWHKVIVNHIDTWDYQLSYLFYSKDLLAIIPPHELAINIGFGPGAAHTGEGVSPLQPIRPVKFPVYPYPKSCPSANKARDRQTFITNYLPNNIPNLFKKKLYKLFRR